MTAPPPESPQRRHARILGQAVLVLLLAAAGLWFRLQIVESYSAPAGDGLGYYALSQELLHEGRYAFGPSPMPLSYARTPGYPLFLARIAVRRAPVEIGEHVARATRWNAGLDVVTATALFAIVRIGGVAGFVPALLAMIGLLCCPMSILLSCYALSESLATLLGVASLLMLICVPRTSRRWRLPVTVGAGLCQGAAMLVRPDMITLLPAALLSLWWGHSARHRRMLKMALFLCAAATIFAPWPLRNWARFHHPHPTGAEWFTPRDGQILPTGFLRWMETWCASEVGDAYLPTRVAWRLPLLPYHPAMLNPGMYDGERERQQLEYLYSRYNTEGLTADVDAGFRRLAQMRTRRDPLRTYIKLPLRRWLALWRPLPEGELPMKSTLLGLPEARPRFEKFDNWLYTLALLGGIWLLFYDRTTRRWLIILTAAVATRSIVIPYVLVIPNQRMMVESFPLLIAIAAAGVGTWARFVATALLGRPLRNP